jgi:hypothetical protein
MESGNGNIENVKTLMKRIFYIKSVWPNKNKLTLRGGRINADTYSMFSATCCLVTHQESVVSSKIACQSTLSSLKQTHQDDTATGHA